MITRIEALEFMQHLVGVYRGAAAEVEFRVRKCGHGVVLELTRGSKVDMIGVVGARGEELECAAQVGLPNLVRLRGWMCSEDSLTMRGDEPQVRLDLSSQGPDLELRVFVEGQEVANHELHRG